MSIELDLIGEEMAEQADVPVGAGEGQTVIATAFKPDYIAPTYVRDDPTYGATSPQSIYRFDNDQGATVTRHQGAFYVTHVAFTGGEITAFAPLEAQETHGSEEVVQLVLNGIKNR
jgi:hypothetical protein